ncbi:MAG: carboxypeptidase regulatory-like domain-containing protein [Candidatus Polarisedimenticolaceae bacterium]|nr:carboxypeptidase regulatory-like domain-containing protein [Candidatus Polarisedimenticolaceae bacterium]
MKKLLISTTIAGLCAMPLIGQAAAYKEVSVSNGGNITGTVAYSGKAKKPKLYSVTKDNDICGTEARKIEYVRVNNGKLMDSVVYLEKIKEGKAFPAGFGDTTVVQEACAFTPFLGVMKNKHKINAINKDPILHNIHTYEIMGRVKKTVFNISQPDQNTISKTVKLKKGAAMKVECDAHDFMHGFVFVAKNPYFAVVAEDGSYTIDNVPAGKYKIKAWHGTLKDQKGKVEVAAGGSTTVDFNFKK